MAIVRRLLLAVWHVLSARASDCHADPVAVACKLMCWFWQLPPEHREGLATRQFIRYGLLRLRPGNGLMGFAYGGMPRRLASMEEVIALFPDLAGPA